MPRHQALIPLSQEHHHTLVLALRLKKGGPTTHKDLWPTDLVRQVERTMEYCDKEILPHFAQEEATIFVKARTLETARPLIDRLLVDHASLREMMDHLAGIRELSKDLIREHLRRLGEKLESHIRTEERELFPMLETGLSEQDWAELAQTGHSRPR